MSSSEHRVTAVITAYNAERYISRAIDSALDQTFGPVHVIVVDDGSSDGTSEVATSYGERVELIRLSENSGPAVGRTTGLMKCTTEFVAFLDSDDYWRPEFVQETVSFLDAHPEAVAVSTGHSSRDWCGRDSDGPRLDEADRGYYKTGGALCPDFYRFWSKYRAVLTGTVMIRTEIAMRTGGQRAELRRTQDLEFWGYLATFGRWAFVPKPLFVTDQRILLPSERMSKFKRDFKFFRDVDLDDWSGRIRPRLAAQSNLEGFECFLGHIATWIALSNAYSFRFRKSYHLAIQWRDRFDRGLGDVLRHGSRLGPVLWPLVCIALRLRESWKAYAKPITRKIVPRNKPKDV